MEKLHRWLLVFAACCALLGLQGCLPPDWSFCDCDFRDNFWNSILNDVHLLWDVRDSADFLRRARDNTTFQGKYLQSPPADLDCPEAPMVFWKAWPQYGITRGLIEGSMGDLWMPGARDRFKQVCIAGHLALLSICSQIYLVKSARALDAGEPDHMRWLEAAYAHMVAIRNLAQAYQLRNCLGQQGWSLKAESFHAYTVKWIGQEAEGTVPQAAFFNGRVDPWNMLYTKPMGHTESTRAAMLPDRKTCVPFKDPLCWKRKSLLLVETCEYCCSPFEHKSGRGAEICWDSEWTYERCCQQDFKDLICEHQRKGEEGGCVDCKKSVTWICLTPPEKRLKDAQDKYNENVDRFNKLQNTSRDLATDIASTRQDLLEKDEIYRDLHTDLNKKLNVWHMAHNNASRLLSVARLQQQELTWNNSRDVLDEAQFELRRAESGVLNTSRILSEARRDEESAKQALQRNVSAFHMARNQFEAISKSLTLAKAARVVAEDAVSLTESSAKEAEVNASSAWKASLKRNASRDDLKKATHSDLERAARHRDQQRASAVKALTFEHASRKEFEAAHSQRMRWPCTEAPAAKTTTAHLKAEESQLAASTVRNKSADDLFAARQDEEQIRHLILACAGDSQPALLCLMAKTPANYSVPKLVVPEGLCVKCTCDLKPAGCEACNQTDSERLHSLAAKAERALDGKRGASDGTEPLVYVPFELTKMVEERKLSTVEARNKQTAAAQYVTEAKSLEQKLHAEINMVLKQQESTQQALKESQHEIGQLTLQISLWEEYLRANKSFLQRKQQILRDLSRRAGSFVHVFEEKKNRTSQLRSEQVLEMNESQVLKIQRDTELKKVSEAEEVVSRANLSENLTRLVSDWLQQQETAEASQSGRWSERLLAAAKEVLVTMVGSLESFLDNYVISLSDKDAVMRMMQAVDRRKESEMRLLKAERELASSLEKVKALNTSLAEAEVEDELARAKAVNFTTVAAQAEENATSAGADVNRTRDLLHNQRQRLESLKRSTQENRAKQVSLTDDLASAKGQLEEQAKILRTSEEAAKMADADLHQALAAEKAAEAKVANAKAAFVGSTLEEARRECQPTKSPYEVYLHFRDALALAKYVVVQRLLALQRAEELLWNETLRLRDAQVVHEAFLDDLQDSFTAQNLQAVLHAAADLDLSMAEGRNELASSFALSAGKNFTESQATLDVIMAERDEADSEAAGQADAYNRAAEDLDLAKKKLSGRRTELESAINETERLSKELLAAIQTEAAANKSLRESRVWQTEFTQSLQLERKEDAVAEAKSEERLRSAIQVNASKREARMRSLLNTHKKHLTLLDTQVELPQKDKALMEARAAFEAAEKKVLDAQTKLDELVKNEAETHKKIAETYEALNRLKVEHSEAEKEYQAQDPEDRKRSFTTSLQGSGA